MPTFYSDSNNSFTSKNLVTQIYPGCPDLLQLTAENKKRYPFLLQSTAVNNNNSRYDILFAFPQQRLVLKRNFELYLDNEKLTHNNFLDTLDTLWKAEKTTKSDDTIKLTLPFTGGWFLYLSYELLGQIEPQVKTHDLAENMDLAVAIRIPAAIICDHKNKQSYLVTELNSTEHLSVLVNDFIKLTNKVDYDNTNNAHFSIIEEQPEKYYQRISKAKKYIYDGDIFQSNLSRQWTINPNDNVNAFSIYNKLRSSNPAAFSGIVNLKNMTIISSSPERLIRVSDRTIETSPIAGTIHRSQNRSQDTSLATNLLNNPKEKAEHIMLIDMERNDLGKVCQTGTVNVTKMMRLESLKHVHHIVSNITGKLKDSATPGDIINALFPGGSITGCPKVRCMEIIHELEAMPRNAYTGSIGYLNNNGDMDLNILIRTIELIDSTITFRTGAGIVNDSEASKELQETKNKAKGLIAALLC